MNVIFGTVENGVITAPLSMRSNFKGIGAWHTLTDEERAKYGWYPATVVNESYDPKTQVPENPILSFDGERITVTHSYADKPLETVRAEALTALAEHRFSVETAGITSATGINQPTDRGERLLLADKLAFMRENPTLATTMWKASGAWYELTTEQLGELQTLVGMHANKCYLAEYIVANKVMSATTIKKLLAIEVATEFELAMV